MEAQIIGKLHDALFSLYKKIKEVVQGYVAEDKLIRIPYQRVAVKDIDYEGESYNLDWANIEYFDAYDWSTKMFTDFIEHRLPFLTEFNNAAIEIISEFKLEEDIVKRIGLIEFASQLIKGIPNIRITDNTIVGFIENFINDYKKAILKKPTIWNVEVWISNLKLESDEIEITPGVFLRKPQKEQLVLVEQRDMHHNELYRLASSVLPALAILSFSVESDLEVSSHPTIALNEIENFQAWGIYICLSNCVSYIYI